MSKQGWASILSCIMIVGIGALGALWIYGTVVVKGGTGPLLAISAQTEDAAVTVNPSKEASQGTTTPSTQEVIKKSQLKVFTVTTTDSLGSGFLFNQYGDVLTNAHVVEGHRMSPSLDRIKPSMLEPLSALDQIWILR